MAYEPVIRYRMSEPSVQGVAHCLQCRGCGTLSSVQGVWHTVFSAGGVAHCLQCRGCGTLSSVQGVCLQVTLQLALLTLIHKSAHWCSHSLTTML